MRKRCGLARHRSNGHLKDLILIPHQHLLLSDWLKDTRNLNVCICVNNASHCHFMQIKYSHRLIVSTDGIQNQTISSSHSVVNWISSSHSVDNWMRWWYCLILDTFITVWLISDLAVDSTSSDIWFAVFLSLLPQQAYPFRKILNQQWLRIRLWIWKFQK